MGNNPFTYKSRLAGLVRSSYMHGLLAFERIEQMTGAMQEISSSQVMCLVILLEMFPREIILSQIRK